MSVASDERIANMIRLRNGFGVVLTWFFWALPSHAELIYSFSFDQPSYTVAQGGSLAVQVFLNETGASGDPFVLAPGGVGMFGTGVRLDYPGNASAKVLSGADISGNPAFDNGGAGVVTDVNPATATAGVTQSVVFNPPVYGTLVSPNDYQLLLATFTFTAGSTPGTFMVSARAVRFRQQPDHRHGSGSGQSGSRRVGRDHRRQSDDRPRAQQLDHVPRGLPDRPRSSLPAPPRHLTWRPPVVPWTPYLTPKNQVWCLRNSARPYEVPRGEGKGVREEWHSD